MTKLAIDLNPVRVSAKTRGFHASTKVPTRPQLATTMTMTRTKQQASANSTTTDLPVAQGTDTSW